MKVHKARPNDDSPAESHCAVCMAVIKRVPGGHGMTWVHRDSGAVAAPGADPAARRAVYVDETMLTVNGYVPAIVVENEAGYHPLTGKGELAQPWYWGHDLAKAKELAAETNALMGLTPTDARDIVASSMRAQNLEQQRQEDAAEHWDRVKKGLPR